MNPLQITGMIIGASALLMFGVLRVLHNLAAERDRIDSQAAVAADAEAFVRRMYARSGDGA